MSGTNLNGTVPTLKGEGEKSATRRIHPLPRSNHMLHGSCGRIQVYQRSYHKDPSRGEGVLEPRIETTDFTRWTNLVVTGVGFAMTAVVMIEVFARTLAQTIEVLRDCWKRMRGPGDGE